MRNMSRFGLVTFLLLSHLALADTNLNKRYLSWGVTPSKDSDADINMGRVLSKIKNKKPIVVAVIDTGIDPNHPFLQGNIYTPFKKISESYYGVDFSTKKVTYTPADQHGHGTHIAGIIKSVYPYVKIYPIKYFDPFATGESSLISTVSALEHAVESNVDIINYSGGGPVPSPQELKALKRAEKRGILVIAAAGNESSNIDVIGNQANDNAFYPGSYNLPNIITVASHNRLKKLSSFSNYGYRTVDISAPGKNIRSAFPKGRVGLLTGTSQSTAFVTGVAALLISEFPKLTPIEIKDIINKSASKSDEFMGRIKSGGILDAQAAYDYALKLYNPTKSPRKRKIATKKKGKIILLKVSNSRKKKNIALEK